MSGMMVCESCGRVAIVSCAPSVRVALCGAHLVPVLHCSVFTRSYSYKRFKSSHIRARLVRCLNIAVGEARVVTGLERIRLLLRGLHVLRCRNERLKPRVRPRGLRLLLHNHLLWRHGRMRSIVYLLLLLILRSANWHRDRSVRWVRLVRIDNDRVIFDALLRERCRHAVAAARVFGRRAAEMGWTDWTSIPCLALVSARRRRLLGNRCWMRLNVLRRYTDGLRRKVPRLLYGHCLSRLPVTFLRWRIRCSDIKAGKALVQTGVRWAVRALWARLAIDHHRACIIPQSMVKALDTR